MKSIGIRLAGLLFVTLALFTGCKTTQADGKPTTDLTYFEFRQNEEQPGFVILLTDPARIAQARAILAGKEKKKVHISGLIEKNKAVYNPNWAFHLKPDSITFFEVAAEACDANPKEIEKHLADVGGSVLPDGWWCPWSSKLVREIANDRFSAVGQ